LFKRILVAIDGSEHADHALTHALDFAEKYDAKIELVTIIPPMPATAYPSEIVSPITETVVDSYYKEMKASHEKIMSEALKKIEKTKPNLKVSTKILEGRPAEKILEIAKEKNSDLIVMGSRGLGGIKEFLLGSVSDRVADEAKCPILIVK
jgi:nucleotide-binding universal stress UspA family protein